MDSYEKLLEEKIENAKRDLELRYKELDALTNTNYMEFMCQIEQIKGEIEAYQDALNEYRRTHAYQVFFVNEDDVMEDLGFFATLEEAEKEVNVRLEAYSAYDHEREGEFFTPRFGPGEKLGRRWLGFELDERYAAIAKARVSGCTMVSEDGDVTYEQQSLF